MAPIDYNLLEIDGFAAAKPISNLLAGAACPVPLGLTASLDRLADGRAELDGGFDGMVAKPNQLADLIAAIECCLNTASRPVDLTAHESPLNRFPGHGNSPRQLDTGGKEMSALRLLMQQALNEPTHAIQPRTEFGEDAARPVAIDNVEGRLTGQVGTVLNGMWNEQTRTGTQ